MNTGNTTRVAVFIGARHGVGTTTLAREVALELAQRAGFKILLLDLDPKELPAPQLGLFEEPRTFMDLVPAWLQNNQISADEFGRAVRGYAAGVDVLCAPSRHTAQDSERSHSYRGREFAAALCETAQEYGYDLILLDAQTFPIAGFTDALMRRADRLFLVGGTPQEDAGMVLDQWCRLPHYLRVGQQFAILRGNNSLWNPVRDLLAEAKLNAFFVPWVNPPPPNDEWSRDPSFQNGIHAIIKEFVPQEGLRGWLPFWRN